MNKYFIGAIIILAVGIVWYVSGMGDSTPAEEVKETEQMTEEKTDDISITPIEHASMVLSWNGKVLYTDPVGGQEKFSKEPSPDIVLVTDIHGDHFDVSTLEAIITDTTKLVVPRAVFEKLPAALQDRAIVLANGEKKEVEGFSVEAVPMYNLPETAEAFHTKGRGNGYVVEASGKRVYISGDTGNIPEMKQLKNIDIAFLCMNLPYTMSVEEAASAVLGFAPKKVIPYHYRGPDGLSDIEKFKSIVNAEDPDIEVELLNFYP